MKRGLFTFMFAFLPLIFIVEPGESRKATFPECHDTERTIKNAGPKSEDACMKILDQERIAVQESNPRSSTPHYVVESSVPSNTNIVKNPHGPGSVSFLSFDPEFHGQITSAPPASPNEMVQESELDRSMVQVQNPKSWDHIATARIVATFYDVYNNVTGQNVAVQANGTAFLVGPSLAVTAGHCVYEDITKTYSETIDGQTIANTAYEDHIDNPRFADKIEFYFGLNGTNEMGPDYPYYAEANYSYIEVDYALTCNIKRDWAAVELDRNIGNQIGWYGKACNITTLGYSVTSYGYPGKNCVPDTMYAYSGVIISNPSDSDFRLRCNFPTVPGQSGSPIFWQDNNGDKYVCGIVNTSSPDGQCCSGPFLNDLIYEFLDRYFASNFNNYSYPYLHFQNTHNGYYQIAISNNSSWKRSVTYNSKMCFFSDGFNWQNLSDLVTITVNPYSSVVVNISPNVFANSIVASYTYQSKRVITCANNVQNTQPSENYNLLNMS